MPTHLFKNRPQTGALGPPEPGGGQCEVVGHPCVPRASRAECARTAGWARRQRHVQGRWGCRPHPATGGLRTPCPLSKGTSKGRSSRFSGREAGCAGLPPCLTLSSPGNQPPHLSRPLGSVTGAWPASAVLPVPSLQHPLTIASSLQAQVGFFSLHPQMWLLWTLVPPGCLCMADLIIFPHSQPLIPLSESDLQSFSFSYQLLPTPVYG